MATIAVLHELTGDPDLVRGVLISWRRLSQTLWPEPTRAFRKSQARFEQAGEEQFFFCRFTQITVLRLLTTNQIRIKDTKTMFEAWSWWHRVWADTRIVLLPEPDDIEREFRSRSRLSSPSPKVWADAYLLAFATAAGLKFVTFDRALEPQDVDVLIL